MDGDVLRTGKTVARYRAAKKKRTKPVDLLALPRVKEFDRWVIVENEYPYDQVLSVHHLLVPKRRFAEPWGMTTLERRELHMLLRNFGKKKCYDSVMLNLPANRTVPTHFHVHLVRFKKLTNI